MEIPHPREAGDPVYSATSASLIPFLSLRRSHSFAQPDSFSLTSTLTRETLGMQASEARIENLQGRQMFDWVSLSRSSSRSSCCSSPFFLILLVIPLLTHRWIYSPLRLLESAYTTVTFISPLQLHAWYLCIDILPPHHQQSTCNHAHSRTPNQLLCPNTT